MKRTPLPTCRHPVISFSDGGRTYRCQSCGQEMVVATTTRSVWAEMGRRLQRLRKGRKAASDQGALEM